METHSINRSELNDEKDAVTQTWDDYKLRKGEVGKNEAMAFRAGFEAGWQARPAVGGEVEISMEERNAIYDQTGGSFGDDPDAYGRSVQAAQDRLTSPQQPDTSVAERAVKYLISQGQYLSGKEKFDRRFGIYSRWLSEFAQSELDRIKEMENGNEK